MLRQRFFLWVLLMCLAYAPLFANEGMWLPNLLKKLNEPEMKSLGMRISAEDIYSINAGSLKDAVVHFGGGCTGEVISTQGLLLTNHHCGYGYIQRHSSTENNYLKYGFWAKGLDEEIPNPGLRVTFIVRIEDVTEDVLRGIQNEMSAEERQSAIDKNINGIKDTYQLTPFEDLFVRPFFEGNEYYLFVTKTYKDVRLVGTPPDFIGKYGADTDNWIWPRHTGDFALFRIYADENNEPADYSPDNRPYSAPNAMKISMRGLKENDFVFAFGFPGRTQQYLHSEAIYQVEHILNPARVAIRERALAIIDAAMRADEKTKIQYASKQSRISNFWKKWKGESLGLGRSNAVEKRRAYEDEFNKRLANNSKEWSKWQGLTDQFAQLYKELNSYALAAEIYAETFQRNPELTRLAFQVRGLANIHENNGEQEFLNRRSRLQSMVSGFYKDYQVSIDRDVFAAMMDYYYSHQPEMYHSQDMRTLYAQHQGDWSKISQYLFEKTPLSSEDKMEEFMNMEATEFLSALEKDPFISFVGEIADLANEKILPKNSELSTEINSLKRIYMEAQRTVFSEKVFSPDANSTLRVSYGRINGYEPRDAVFFEPFTTIDGVMEKYIPGDYEFDLDDKFRKLVEDRDFGKYEVDGTVPVNFIAALHTTGGNSGSPVLNGDGHLVGLLFDGAWEGVMSDIYYSEELVRSIMVDIRYVLFIMDKYAGADHLMKELVIIDSSTDNSGKAIK